MNVIRIRAASHTDSEDIFTWRNHKTTRLMSLNSEKITWAEHCEWYRAALKNSNKTLLISYLEECNSSVGMVRFDRTTDSAVISINLDPEMRGKKLALRCLQAAIEFYRVDACNLFPLHAQLRLNNVASDRVFTQAGFILESTENDIKHLKLGI